MPATYRYDVSPNNRAGCQSVQCKDAGLKIMKGELRFATLVTINEHDSWKYKHWGCVTPLQISNIVNQIGGLDGLDLETDLDILDGYDELEPWAQEKVKFALKNGHVEDEDWKGDPELNRPGQKGITKKRTPKKKKTDEDDEENVDAENDATPSKPKAKKGRGKAKVEEGDDEDGSPAPKKKAAGKKRKAAEVTDQADGDEEEEKPKKKRTARKPKTSVKDENVEDESPAAAAPKKRGQKATKVEEADIPGVDGAADTSENKAVPSKRAKRSRKVKDEAEDQDVKNEPGSEDELADESLTPAKKTKPRKSKKATVKNEEPEADATKDDDEPVAPVPKSSKQPRGRGKKQKEPAIDADVPIHDEEGVQNIEDDREVTAQSKAKKGRSKKTKVEAE